MAKSQSSELPKSSINHQYSFWIWFIYLSLNTWWWKGWDKCCITIAIWRKVQTSCMLLIIMLTCPQVWLRGRHHLHVGRRLPCLRETQLKRLCCSCLKCFARWERAWSTLPRPWVCVQLPRLCGRGNLQERGTRDIDNRHHDNNNKSDNRGLNAHTAGKHTWTQTQTSNASSILETLRTPRTPKETVWI